MPETILKKILLVALLVLLALVSFFFIGDMASEPEAHAKIIASIDDKADTVLKLTATSTVASACISAIPDDTATPIAEKLADFTEDFLLILCVLYAEKYLLTIIGAGTFKILVPIACLLLSVGICARWDIMKKLALKFAVFGLAIFVAIPASIRVSDMIYENYSESVDSTLTAAESFTENTSELTEAKGDEGLLNSIISKLSDTATGLANKAADLLKSYVESLAVMIVTSCVIPLVVLLFFVWIIKLLTGIEIPVGIPGAGRRRGGHRPRVENAADAL